MKKRLILGAVCACIAVGGLMAAVGNYSAFNAPAPGRWKYGTGLGKIAHIRITNATPTNGTVILSRVSSDLAKTTTLFTVTCEAGAYEADLGPAALSVETSGTTTTGGAFSVTTTMGAGTNYWLAAGDYVLRGGTVTSTNECLLILDGQ